jgi:DNA polymerase
LKAFIDFETRSTVELKRTGVYPYAMHLDTDVWCMAWALEFDQPRLWEMGDPFPDELRAHIEAGGELWAHNAQFERVIWRDVMSRRYEWPEPAADQWWCTAAEAARMALPRHLEGLCHALRLPFKKDMEGHRLMLRMCRPRKFNEDGSVVWWDDRERRTRLGEYCKTDVVAEQSAWKQLNRLSPIERETFLMTERINDLGVAIDLPLVIAMRDAADKEIARQNALLSQATGGKVSEVTKVARIKAWLAEQGVVMESLAKKSVQELLDDGKLLSPEVEQAINARREAGKSSVKKLDSLLETQYGGRSRGLLLYHGASTGRWAGRGPQIHNFPRGGDVDAPERYIPNVHRGEPLPLATLSAMLRSTIVPTPGHRFYCADFSAVEARVDAWVAGEEYMLQQFREKRKLYIEMAEAIFKRPIDKEKDVEEYTAGKSAILGCGFGMGWKKFVSQFGADEEIAQRAVKMYRETYPHIVSLWDAANDAALAALWNPGKKYGAGRVEYVKSGAHLLCRLPSKRVLFYPDPQVIDRPMPWDETDIRPAVSFMGMNAYTHQWERLSTYGGSLTENFVQAIARDLLRDAMLRVERHGYTLVASVHDEILAEHAEGDLDEFMGLMVTVPEWAERLPIDATGWKGERWRK